MKIANFIYESSHDDEELEQPVSSDDLIQRMKTWRTSKAFKSTVTKHITEPNRQVLGYGSAAVVDADDYTGHDDVRRTAEDWDGTAIFLQAILKDPEARQNPYFPKVKSTSNKDGVNVSIVERLLPFPRGNIRKPTEHLMLTRIKEQMFDETKLAADVLYLYQCNAIADLLMALLHRHTFEAIKDSDLLFALQFIEKVQTSMWSRRCIIDIHDYNIMLRPHPYTPHLVITDPLYADENIKEMYEDNPRHREVIRTSAAERIVGFRKTAKRDISDDNYDLEDKIYDRRRTPLGHGVSGYVDTHDDQNWGDVSRHSYDDDSSAAFLKMLYDKKITNPYFPKVKQVEQQGKIITVTSERLIPITGPAFSRSLFIKNLVFRLFDEEALNHSMVVDPNQIDDVRHDRWLIYVEGLLYDAFHSFESNQKNYIKDPELLEAMKIIYEYSKENKVQYDLHIANIMIRPHPTMPHLVFVDPIN